ncbi:hypothetical protein [Enterovirga aerilata]|uniref:Uncharacterized protein n=1 Tax=Enterovirga aerilata TaxID=2730920 RepID=A0A849ID66_9HYPH|nr:hypothetical protein [Enterovirga sp. DB1703]NNM71853.1 hypothetical protein [Enterovirga sp. DB1703]
MLVYGDAVRRETIAAKVDRIRRYLDEAGLRQLWIVAHGLLVAALIEAGELAQGIADRAFQARGRRDAPSPEADAAMAVTLALARLVGASWRDSWRDTEIATAPALDALARLEAVAASGEITIKLPEGFAHYALYPESYFEAALPLAGRNLTVIGIRSIGTTLAAMVAAAADAPCPVTVRPVGHPFGRELALADGTLGLSPDAELAIVDEGPGLSGSSIGATAEAAMRDGAEPRRVHVFPSHMNGPGPQAGERAKSFWRSAQIRFRSFDELALSTEDARHRLDHWVADLVGEPVAPIREISGGGWLSLRFTEARDWPPVHPWQERRKFLVETASGKWLMKFAGLGRIGLDKYERAKALAETGLVPRPLGFRHGFIVERWHGDARPLDPFGPYRPRLVTLLGEYLGFRAKNFPAGRDWGASSEDLFEMLRFNTEEEFGAEPARSLENWRPLLPRLGDGARRVVTDNRLQAWEWLLLPDGRILKTDAVDHHAAHDLVGCQDITWDIAGASVEFTLSPGEQRDLIEAVERVSGFAVDRAQIRYAALCYPAFQLGYYREATSSAVDSTDAARLRDAADRYGSVLHALLLSPDEPNPGPAN